MKAYFLVIPFFLLVGNGLWAQAPQVQITQLDRATGDTTVVSLQYSLADPNNDLCEVWLRYSTDGGRSFRPLPAATGDVGFPISPGNRSIQFSTNQLQQVGALPVQLRVVASDRQPVDVAQLVAQVDSKDMGLPVWQALARRIAVHLERPEVSALIVTHGTDTLEETAFVLQQLFRPGKPVVLTCAMRPASALVPDGPQNLSDAVAVARHAGAGGVVVVCAGQVHGALEVAKVHTYRLDAFDSGDAGPLACVEDGQVRSFRPWSPAPAGPTHGTSLLARLLAASALPRVELITSHADASGDLVRALLAQGASDADRVVRGIVVAGTGNGTVHQALADALDEAEARGVRVVLASRCARGRVPTAHGDIRCHPMRCRRAMSRRCWVTKTAGSTATPA